MSLFYRRKPQSMSAAVTTLIPSFTTPRGPDPVPHVIKDRGLAIEPIVGLRAFQIDLEIDFSPRLVSFNNVGWPARQPMYGQCLYNLLAPHDVPDESCACGIYAWNKDNAGMLGGVDVTGEVYLWGDVLVADLGYRAEIAYPKSLTIKAKSTRNVIRIRDGLMDAYGVPVDLVDPEPQSEGPYDVSSFGSTGATGATHIVASGGLCAPVSPFYWQPITPPTGSGS